jgi:hypothetical protein
MHFGMKSYLKSNRNHTAKQTLNAGKKTNKERKTAWSYLILS